LPGARHRIYNPSVGRASVLYRLQQIDLTIDQASARMAAVDAELSEHSKLKAAQDEASRTEAASRQVSQAARAAEDAVASQRGKVDETEKKLYGGSVHSPKELQELQAEAEALRRHLATLEDLQLDEMMELEQAEKAADAARARLELAQADSSGRDQNLNKERERLAAMLGQRSEEREAAADGVSQEDMLLYQNLRRNSGGLAVAEMLDGTCGACGLTLAASARQEVRSGLGLIRCQQCGRILYAG
jgi:predicted  nucleic acid-binding Zn-ribbon protein